MTTPSFADLGVAEPLLRALATEGYEQPTPIQIRAIPELLDGRDLLGIAQTGTGKTAAFALPILQHLAAKHERAAPRSARAVILAPTRELAIQIADSIKIYGGNQRVRLTVIMGGVGQQPQVRAMQRGVDILIATPGRMLDLANQGHLHLGSTSHFVLDEADRMLDMGFIHDVRKVVKMLPKERQTLLFSATMPDEVARLARDLLRDPVRVEIAAKTVAVERIEQQVHHAERAGKRELLANLLADPGLARVIVFTRTKHGADRVVKQLERTGVDAEAIHGNKSQNARQRALDNFRGGRTRVLVATDIASRGIDVDDVTHVINYELPNEPESYIHRIGRTARAGADGIAISFCEASERPYLAAIEKLIKRRIAVVGNAPEVLPVDDRSASRGKPATPTAANRRRRGRAPRSNSGQRRAA